MPINIREFAADSAHCRRTDWLMAAGVATSLPAFSSESVTLMTPCGSVRMALGKGRGTTDIAGRRSSAGNRCVCEVANLSTVVEAARASSTLQMSRAKLLDVRLDSVRSITGTFSVARYRPRFRCFESRPDGDA